jgi:hypothetical protein
MGAIGEFMVMGRAYWKNEYPPFLYLGKNIEGFLPAFCYHDLPAEEFEAHLHFLKENDYQTLNCNEAVERIGRRIPNNNHEVLLTFDDGLAGFYTSVYPLLKEYRMKAVAYIAPAWIGRPGFLTWDQCRQMHASGWVDIQSHSYAHTSLVTSLNLVRIWRRSDRSPIPLGIPGLDPSLEDGRISCLPVLEGASLFSGHRSLRISNGFWQECARVEPLTANRDLTKRYKSLLERYVDSVIPIDEKTLCEWMRDDLRRSREAIEQATPGHSVRHLAFPWHANSILAWEAAEAAGFVSAAIGLENTDKSRGCYGGLTRILRVNADFLPCLPGRYRSGFLRVLAAKAWRRVWGQNVYGIAN